MILRPVLERFAGCEAAGHIREALSQAAPFIEGVSPSSFALLGAALFQMTGRQVMLITDTPIRMNEIALDLSCFLDEKEFAILPPWETLPYEFISPPEKTERDRVTALYRILGEKPCVIVTTVEALVRLVPPRDFFLKRGICLSTGDDYPFDDIIDTLVSYGYSRESRVEVPGQFSVKGGIIDVFLSTREYALRLDFFGDTLESIREFDVEDQVSRASLDRADLYPRTELILFQREREELRLKLMEAIEEGAEFPDEMAEAIRDGLTFRGVEDLFPLVMETSPLTSYLKDDVITVIMDPMECDNRRDLTGRTFVEMYERKKDATLCLEPGRLVDTAVYDRVRSRSVIIQTITSTPGALRPALRSLPGFHGKIPLLRQEISRRMDEGWRIIITTGFEGQARRLMDLLAEYKPAMIEDGFDSDAPLSVVITPLREGLEIHDTRTLILADHDIFGKSYRKRRSFKGKSSRPIESFLDLREGDLVVHINHGIGIFRGIERMAAGGVERDFLLIEYADSDRLYVSLDQITMVQKYIGMEGRRPELNHLGKKSSWNRIKQKVRESVEEIARELIRIYSTRSAVKGYQYPPDTLWQEEFETLFEYEETADQITAIEDVKDDMESQKPMDRLVCGDVGFGKTEVAIRAAFKAVMAGRQVAILVPTTVLAMQHFNTFRRRFADYPIIIDMLSRFRSAAEMRSVKHALSEGRIDIIIGTHALLTKDLVIKNLGLLVIDEEQRFGVKHKEELKRIRTNVDVLTLSATPIPRTIHMAMAGIRDLSTISTPPENRQAIETYVLEENPDILRMAILNEIKREGQVFFVHNRVQTIDVVASQLGTLVPEATFCVAHGQMHEHELEEIMIDFLERKYDVLVSTTIIESGLDIPNANTIIINRADTFGLSQLYQLKGRVGRSERQAYAYLFHPKHVALTEDAAKRLEVIAEYSELGSGLKIAMKDLEIRGAGNILGREQSGNIMEVGFDLYCQMLEDAVKTLKGEKSPFTYRTPVFIKTDFFIPDAYIADQRQKIEFYKRFESCNTVDEVEVLREEMIDRFGPPPGEVNVLVELERVRALASSLHIDDILEQTRSIRIRLTAESLADPEKIIQAVSGDKRLSLDPSDSQNLIFTPRSTIVEKKLQELKKFLQDIS